MLENDVDHVAELDLQSYAFPWTAGNFHDSMRAGYRCCLYEEAGSIMAYAVMMAVVDEVHLLNLTVIPALQGLGYGAAFLRRLVACSRESGFAVMWLEVRPSNHAARALYEGFGFRQVGLRKGYYPASHGREDGLVMVLELQNAQ